MPDVVNFRPVMDVNHRFNYRGLHIVRPLRGDFQEVRENFEILADRGADNENDIVVLRDDLSSLEDRVTDLEQNETQVTSPTDDYEMTVDDVVILGNASSKNIIITLPSASESSGKICHFKKLDATANTMTVSGNGANIDGSGTAVLTLQWEAIALVSDGTNWYII